MTSQTLPLHEETLLLALDDRTVMPVIITSAT